MEYDDGCRYRILFNEVLGSGAQAKRRCSCEFPPLDFDYLGLLSVTFMTSSWSSCSVAPVHGIFHDISVLPVAL